jgi:hypothetical protein
MDTVVTVAAGAVCLIAGVAGYAAIIRYALVWSRRRWDPHGDSRPIDDG